MALPPAFLQNAEVIKLTPLKQLIPGSTIFDESNVISFSMSFTLQGGSFSISMLRGTIDITKFGENTVITMPFGRVGIATNVGGGWSPSGMVDTISGPLIPLPVYGETAFGLAGNQNASLANIANVLLSGGGLGGAIIGGGTSGSSLRRFSAPNPFVTGFNFRGKCLSGLQQVAGMALADVIIKSDGVYIVNPGEIVGGEVTVPSTDIVSVTQLLDWSQDVKSELNPAILNINAGLPQVFVYDSDHAQKQPKFTVRTGSPGSLGSQDFIEIPDGWLVDGNYEEWTPADPTQDLTNPAASVTNGRYWKVLPSPTNPGQFRGITNFTRLVKQIIVPPNCSSFIGSPVTGDTKQGTLQEFSFNTQTDNDGIYGFDSADTANGTTLFDVVSHRYYTFPNAIVLIPGDGGSSGEGADNFYSITMETWQFPLVNPTTFQGGPSANPFNIPPDVVIVTPPTNVLNGVSGGFYNAYLVNFKKRNSPWLRTTISTVYRNFLPQPGDHLSTPTLTYTDCGRIATVTLNFSRSGGVVLSMTAEKYQAAPGLYQFGGSGGAIIGGGF